jgi:anti-sigma regulatory factor (Ser/Thr protein kinase)
MAVAAQTPSHQSATGELIMRFGAQLGAPALARSAVTEALRALGYEGPLLDDVTIVVSELAANAVCHDGSGFLVRLCVDGPVVRIALEDGGPATACVRMTPRRMHGLGLVDALALDWGVEATAGGKAVWAELDLRARRLAGAERRRTIVGRNSATRRKSVHRAPASHRF